MSNSSEKRHLDVDSITTRSFTLVDSNGKVKASLFTTENQSASESSTVIQLLGDSGLPRLELQVDGDDPGIRLTSRNDRVGFAVSINPTSNGLMIGDANGNSIAEIGVYHDSKGCPTEHCVSLVLSDRGRSGETIKRVVLSPEDGASA